MSSNKTIIPGMEDAYTEQPNFGKQTTKVQDGTCVPNPFGTIPTTPSMNNPNIIKSLTVNEPIKPMPASKNPTTIKAVEKIPDIYPSPFSLISFFIVSSIPII